MRFFLSLTWILIFECGGSNGVYGASPFDLSFSVYLEINHQFIYPEGQAANVPNSKPFEIVVNVKGLMDQSIKTILLDLLGGGLGISKIEKMEVNLISFQEDGAMITHVESCSPSSITSPVASEDLSTFPVIFDLLDLSKGDLIDLIHETSLRVSIESSTDSIYSVGYRLCMKELGFSD